MSKKIKKKIKKINSTNLNNNIKNIPNSGTATITNTYNKQSDSLSSSNNNQSQPKSKLCCFGYVDYIVLASTLAVALGEELSLNDLNILSTFFAVLSDELALISSVESCNTNEYDDIFVPPVPDLAMTSLNKSSKNRTRIKKVIKRKVKKK